MMIFGLPNISAGDHRIFKILVSTLHNYPLIIGDRHKNFEDPMLSGQDTIAFIFFKCPVYKFPLNPIKHVGNNKSC